MRISTLTILLLQEQRAALKETVKRFKKSASDMIRELLAREFRQVAFGERAVEFMGCLESSPSSAPEPDSFREAIRRANWRPS